MTKKFLNLGEKLNEKMDTIVFLHEIEVIDRKKAYERLRKERDEFDDLRSLMFHYGLLSESDFTETTFFASEMMDRKYDKIIDVECAR